MADKPPTIWDQYRDDGNSELNGFLPNTPILNPYGLQPMDLGAWAAMGGQVPTPWWGGMQQGATGLTGAPGGGGPAPGPAPAAPGGGFPLMGGPGGNPFGPAPAPAPAPVAPRPSQPVGMMDSLFRSMLNKQRNPDYKPDLSRRDAFMSRQNRGGRGGSSHGDRQ